MTYGFIGTGNMAGALARALSKTVPGQQIHLHNRTPAKAETLAAALGAHVSPREHIAQTCDCIFLGVKPQGILPLLAELRPLLDGRRTPALLVSMAAGVTLRAMEEAAPGAAILRIMPNTACAVGEGLTLYDCGGAVTERQLADLLRDMAAAGRWEHLPESLIDAGSAVAGCGGAFADLFMEALADGGVACGLPRDKANTFAAQMLLGAARLALDSGKHFGALKDDVCSPGGSTIAGVHALEAGGFRAAAMNAVVAAYRRTLEMKQ